MIELDRLPGTIHAVSLVKRQAATEDADGLLEKRLTLRVEVDKNLDDVVGAFPGIDLTVKSVSGDDHPGLVMKSRRKALDVTVTITDPTGEKIMEPAVMRAGVPTLTIGQGGKTVTLQVVVQGVLPKASQRALDDFYRADVCVSIVPAQVDHVDEAKKTVRGKKAPAKTTAVQGDLPH